MCDKAQTVPGSPVPAVSGGPLWGVTQEDQKMCVVLRVNREEEQERKISETQRTIKLINF